jgi:hypothetical protein
MPTSDPTALFIDASGLLRGFTYYGKRLRTVDGVRDEWAVYGPEHGPSLLFTFSL